MVGAHVEADRQRLRGVDARRCDVERELADRDAHAARALVAEAEDALVVRHHDQAHVLVGVVGEHLAHAALVLGRDPEAARAPEDLAVLLARQPHRGRVDDRQELLEVVAEHPVEQVLVAVLQRGEADVALERRRSCGRCCRRPVAPAAPCCSRRRAAVPESPSARRSSRVNAVARLYIGWLSSCGPRRRTSTRSRPSAPRFLRYASINRVLRTPRDDARQAVAFRRGKPANLTTFRAAQGAVPREPRARLGAFHRGACHDPPLLAPRDGAALVRREPLRDLARGRDRRDRGAGRARSGAEGSPRCDPRAGALRRQAHRGDRARGAARRDRVRLVRGRERRARGTLPALRPHLVRRRRHGALDPDARRDRPGAGGARWT